MFIRKAMLVFLQPAQNAEPFRYGPFGGGGRGRGTQVGHKIGDQVIHRHAFVGFLFTLVMAMIPATFAVVVPDDPFPPLDIDQRIFEAMWFVG